MKRRECIGTITATVSSLAIAGCSGDGNSTPATTSTSTNTPTDTSTSTPTDTSTSTPTDTRTPEETQYTTGSEDELLLSISAFPEGWIRDDGISGDDFDRAFKHEDEENAVFVDVDIYEEIATAENAFAGRRARFSDTNDYSIADESYWTTFDEFAFTAFRHRNAKGQVAATSRSSSGFEPDEDRSQDYAEQMYDQW